MLLHFLSTVWAVIPLGQLLSDFKKGLMTHLQYEDMRITHWFLGSQINLDGVVLVGSTNLSALIPLHFSEYLHHQMHEHVFPSHPCFISGRVFLTFPIFIHTVSPMDYSMWVPVFQDKHFELSTPKEKGHGACASPTDRKKA